MMGFTPEEVRIWIDRCTIKAALLFRPCAELEGNRANIDGTQFICVKTRTYNSPSPSFAWELAAGPEYHRLGIIWPEEFWRQDIPLVREASP